MPQEVEGAVDGQGGKPGGGTSPDRGRGGIGSPPPDGPGQAGQQHDQQGEPDEAQFGEHLQVLVMDIAAGHPAAVLDPGEDCPIRPGADQRPLGGELERGASCGGPIR
jgi:hypothetical protein